MVKKPIVSIIIPTIKEDKLFLNKCLDSIFKNTSVSFEVIIVTNNLKLESRYKKRNNLKVKEIKKDIGPAAKRNFGVKLSKGKYILFLDSDTIVDKNFLKKTVFFLDKNPKIAGGQLKILKIGTKNFDSAGEKITPFGFLAERARGTIDKSQFDFPEYIFSGKTAAMIFRKNIFLKVGGFDKDYYMYWEEPDLCWRIWKLGYKIVFLGKDTVWHAYDLKNKKTSYEKLVEITFLGCRNQIATIIKNAVVPYFLISTFFSIFSWIMLSLSFLINFKIKRFIAVWAAIFQNLANLSKNIRKRKEIKRILKEKYYSDHQWLSNVISGKNIFWYFGKAISYTLNKPF